MAKGQFTESGSNLGHRNWPIGPYRAASMRDRMRGKEVGSSVEFCYPNEQYDAFNQQRQEAQTRMMVLAPRMAEAILTFTDAETNPLPYPLDEYAPQWMHDLYDLGDELRAIDGGRMYWVALDSRNNILYRSEDRNDVIDYRDSNDGVNHIGNMFIEADRII